MGGLNTYLYALANPISGIDPFGLATYRYGGNQYTDKYNPTDPSCEKKVRVGAMYLWKPCSEDAGCGEDDPKPNPEPGAEPPPYVWPGFPGHPGSDGGGGDLPAPVVPLLQRNPVMEAVSGGMCASGPILGEIITSIGLAPLKAGKILKHTLDGELKILTVLGVKDCFSN